MNQPLQLEERIQGNRNGRFLQELFGNSIHFPLVNVVLELLLKGPQNYLLEPDPYLLLFAGLLQAWIVSGWAHAGRPRPLIGNLIGPGFYTLVELLHNGTGFFSAPNHIAYWGFALSIGLLQYGSNRLQGMLCDLLILLENVVRASFVLVMYVILERLLGECQGMGPFFIFPSHQFLAVVIPFLGFILGLSQVNSKGFLESLRATAQQLQKYSEWLFGRELLTRAVVDPQQLSLKRRERAIVFVDIRGFTAWSEGRTPEEVVDLINRFYAVAEPLWQKAIRVKLIADEIMLVFTAVEAAVRSARSLCSTISRELSEQGLQAGVGLHFGPVVEGLVGPPSQQSYDLLGESVNTAKRLCDHAAGGEVLISEHALEQLEGEMPVGKVRELTGKGVGTPIKAFPLDPIG